MKVCIFGQPNVGKSTLFNAVVGTRSALVSDMPGMTRDYKEGYFKQYTIIDTPGVDLHSSDDLQIQLNMRIEALLVQAVLILFVIDASSHLSQYDLELAKFLRDLNITNVLMVCNKAENIERFDDAFRFGFGEPILISAAHRANINTVKNAIEMYASKSKTSYVSLMNDIQTPSEVESYKKANDNILTIALIGRPNSGKSTFMNNILGYERVLTGPQAGLTRDSISSVCEFNGNKIKIIDTPGQKKGRRLLGIEGLCVIDAKKAIAMSHGVILLMDARQAGDAQDLYLASYAHSEGKFVIGALNKWDLIVNRTVAKQYAMDKFRDKVHLCPLTGMHGIGNEKIFSLAFDLYEKAHKNFSTSFLNNWLKSFTTHSVLPSFGGRQLKIKYITQKSVSPQSFIIFTNIEIPSAYIEFFTKSIKNGLHIKGVPVKIIVKQTLNPYD